MNNSTSTRIADHAIASASSNPSTSTSSMDSNSTAPQGSYSANNNSLNNSNGSACSTPLRQTTIPDDARSTGRSNSAPQSVGGDQPIGTKSKEVATENKDVTAR